MGSKSDIKLQEYFEKLLSENISNNEKERLQAYISSGFRDKELDQLMLQHWNGIQQKRPEQNDLYLQQLRNKIWTKISGNKEKQKQHIGWKTYFMRIAAILFIPLLISSLYLFYLLSQNNSMDGQGAMQQIYASPGSRVHFTLPDKSEVWLNSGSTLEYPVNFTIPKQRRVKLNGQGYFKVTHDGKHPFFVETGELNIKVLGTSFDVSTYADDPFISSTLEKGSIVLVDLQGKEISRLKPGQKVLLDRETRKLSIENIDTRLVTSWKDGRLIFRNTPLNEVARQLERWFNCSIHVSLDLLSSDILYTATIQDETLSEVLKMIEISTSVKTKIKNREVTIQNKN